MPPPPVDGVISTKLATIWKLIKSVPQTNNTGIFWNQGRIVILQSRVFSSLFHFPKFYTLSSSIDLPSSTPLDPAMYRGKRDRWWGLPWSLAPRLLWEEVKHLQDPPPGSQAVPGSESEPNICQASALVLSLRCHASIVKRGDCLFSVLYARQWPYSTVLMDHSNEYLVMFVMMWCGDLAKVLGSKGSRPEKKRGHSICTGRRIELMFALITSTPSCWA